MKNENSFVYSLFVSESVFIEEAAILLLFFNFDFLIIFDFLNFECKKTYRPFFCFFRKENINILYELQNNLASYFHFFSVFC
jgi:hypothetical protein